MKQERKELLIFLAVAYGLTFLMGIPMGILFQAGKTVYAFPSAQMFYPAAALMLAKLICEKENPLLPKNFFQVFLAVTGVMVLWCFTGFFLPDEITTSGSSYLRIIGTVVIAIFYFREEKDRRSAYRLTSKHWGLSVRILLLFVVLWLARSLFSAAVELGADGVPALVPQDPTQILMALVMLLISFCIGFAPFLGEEYGWRTYFQPLLQKKFGMIKGVFLFGVLWEFWHLPLVIFYYAPEGGESLAQTVVMRYGNVILMAIFMAYAYLKTQNVWLPVLIHLANNGLASLSESFGMGGGNATWTSIGLTCLLQAALFLPFLFSKVFRQQPCQPDEGEPGETNEGAGG